MVLHEERLEDLALAAIASRPRTAGGVAARLRPWLGAGALGAAHVEEPLVRARRRGHVAWVQGRFRVTERGQSRLRACFGGDPFRGGGPGALIAPALGLEGVAPARLRTLSNPRVLRAEVLRQRHRLALPAVSSPAAVEEALAWALLERGASPRVRDALEPRGGLRRSPARMLGALVWSELERAGEPIPADLAQLRPTRLLDRGIARLVAYALSAPDAHPRSLVRRVLHRWVVQAAGQRDPTREAAFVARALDAARASPTGRFGDHLVLIAHAWRQWTAPPTPDPDREGGRDGRLEHAVSLDRFKAALLRAHQRRALSLKAADMPQLHDPADLAESEVRYRRSRFHFIRI